jgi:4-hydroxybenzoate polyprenyltransferase
VTAVPIRLRDWLSLVRFSHSVFALPFALIALLVATGGAPSPRLLVLVVLAAVAARTAAMAYNRYADRDVDAANPRTSAREIPRGAITPGAALVLAAAAAVGFVLIAAAIAPVCGWLALPCLLLLLGYSHSKRFTALSHFWLGLALALAPLGAWVAARGAIDGSLWAAAWLAAGVLCWVAGFDVLYALADVEFDRGAGLHSLPARRGPQAAIRVARVLTPAAVLALAGFGVAAGLSLPYFAALAAGGGALLAALLRSDRAGAQVLQRNGWFGVVVLLGTLADLYLWPGT